MDTRLRDLERRANAGDEEAARLLRVARGRTELLCAWCGASWGALELKTLGEQGMTCGACWPGPGWELAGSIRRGGLIHHASRWGYGPGPRPTELVWVVRAECSTAYKLHPSTIRWVDCVHRESERARTYRPLTGTGPIFWALPASPIGRPTPHSVRPHDWCRRCLSNAKHQSPASRAERAIALAAELIPPPPVGEVAPLFRGLG